MPSRAFLALACIAALRAEESRAQCNGLGEPACPSVAEEGDEVGLLSLRASVRAAPTDELEAPALSDHLRSLETHGRLPAHRAGTIGTPAAQRGPFPQPAADSKDCPIRSPREYSDAWDKLSAVPAGTDEHPQPGCLSQNLYGSVYQCGSPTLYAETAQKAWIFSKVDLEQLLYTQWRFGFRNASVVTAASLVIIGFGPPALSGDLEGWCLAVFTLPKKETTAALVPAVPTVTYWFTWMSQQGYFFDYNLQQDLTLAYSRVLGNVLDVFHRLTNCSKAALKQDPLPAAFLSGNAVGATRSGWTLPPSSHCSKSSYAVYTALEEVAEQGTEGCVNKFWKNKDNAWSLNNIGDVRMMLFRCFDANPFNTFVGLGWNSYPNPMVCRGMYKPKFLQTNRDHYTGKEFVIDNRPITEFSKFKSITLATADQKSNAYVMKRGFCW